MKPIFLSTFVMVLLAGTWVGAATQNRALEFKTDPDSFFEAPDDPVFHEALGSEFTVEAWVFPVDQAGERMILNKEDSWELGLDNGNFQAALHPGDAWAWHPSGLSAEAEEWSHVAMTWDGAEVIMFVNGEKAAGKGDKPGNKLNVTDSTFKIGRRVRGDAVLHSIFDGLVDEVRISKGLRYTKDYDIPVEGFEPDADTMALYHLDEEVGGVIKDFSANGVDGKLVGNAKLVDIDLDNTALSVESRGKLATVWGRLKTR